MSVRKNRAHGASCTLVLLVSTTESDEAIVASDCQNQIYFDLVRRDKKSLARKLLKSIRRMPMTENTEEGRGRLR